MFVIKTAPALYWFVQGFDRQHQMVQVNDDLRYAKKFPSEFAAEQFLAVHSDVGHGLKRADSAIVKI